MITTIKEINSNTVIVGDFNTTLTPMEKSSRQKINKETQAINSKVDQIEQNYIYRTFHQKAAEWTFFSSSHGTFSSINHILGHKSMLSKFKNGDIMLGIFSDYNAMRLEMN